MYRRLPPDIYTKDNPYGYRYNVNHPYISDLYRRFKQAEGYRWDEPIPDAARLRFEAAISGAIEKALSRAND